MNLFISNDLGTGWSGDIVCKQELMALESLGDKVITIGHEDMSPGLIGLPDSPFLQDYLTMEKISNLQFLGDIKLAHFYSTPFPQTVRYLKALGIKVTQTCVAHDRMESIKEFENLGLKYPFNHISDERLWKIYSSDVRRADLVICPSLMSKKFLIKEGINENKIRVISHGVDIPKFYEICNIPEPFNVGYMGGWGPDKGLRYLIQAWSLLDYKDSMLVIAGRGTEHLGPFIQKYAIRDGDRGRGRFHLMGWVDNIDDFYDKIAVYIQPSVSEGFGMECLEAMSRGRTVICSDGAGASDLINDGKNGFVIRKRDIRMLMDRIDYLKNKCSNLTGIGIAAREKTAEYSWDKVREMYVKTWKELLRDMERMYNTIVNG